MVGREFCYDDLDRLTWASSATASGPDLPGTSTPCASNTAGSLSGPGSQNALYTASYSYDNLDRLTTGPADGGSSYTYGDPAHLHAATSTSGGYSATYDAAGNMVCRAPTGAATCTGSSPTGQGLTYDNEGQLTGWTSALHGAPTPNTAAFAYDGEGSRVAMQTVLGSTGTTTTTDYLLGGLEEQQTVGGSHPSSTLTEYYPIPGIGTAVRVTSSGTGTSTLSYLASDGLGSVTVALSTTGTVTAQALYSPYGTVRYASGTMPTAHGYTGQLADAMTGLSYYGARYYDPGLGEFTSADTEIEGGLDRYAYVGDSPCTYNDPSGNCRQRSRFGPAEWMKTAVFIANLLYGLLTGNGGPSGTKPVNPAVPTHPTAQQAPQDNTPDNAPQVPYTPPNGAGNYGGANDYDPESQTVQDIAQDADATPCPKRGRFPRVPIPPWVSQRLPQLFRLPSGAWRRRYEPIGEPLPVSSPYPVSSPLPAPGNAGGFQPAHGPLAVPGQGVYSWGMEQALQDQPGAPAPGPASPAPGGPVVPPGVTHWQEGFVAFLATLAITGVVASTLIPPGAINYLWGQMSFSGGGTAALIAEAGSGSQRIYMNP